MTVVVRLGPAPTWPRMQIVKQGLSRIETLRIKKSHLVKEKNDRFPSWTMIHGS